MLQLLKQGHSNLGGGRHLCVEAQREGKAQESLLHPIQSSSNTIQYKVVPDESMSHMSEL